MSIMRAAATLAAPVVLAISLLGPGTALGQLSDEEINALDERVISMCNDFRPGIFRGVIKRRFQNAKVFGTVI